jgi:SAM-dependent methyltransferase
MSTIKLNYGESQYLLSEKMQSIPSLGKLLNKVMGYTNIGNYARAKVFTKQVSQLHLSGMKKVLDLGCGYGENAIMMSNALPGAEITALDIDKKALGRVQYAKSKLGIDNMQIHEGRIDTLSHGDFDLVYSVDVFEHIPVAEMPFSGAFEKLKKGGYLLVKIPNKVQRTFFEEKYFEEHNQWVDHEHPGQVYFLNDLKERFEKEGFKVIYAEQTDGILARLAWEIAYFMKKGGSILQLAGLPFCKLLVTLDLVLHPHGSKNGNAITVIGQKI